MALAQRSSSRFFAAFYQWSRHARQSSAPTTRAHTCPATLSHLRCYHATRRLHEDQSVHGFLRDDGDEDAPAFTPALLKEDVRRLMRKVPASVAVITVAHHDAHSNKHVPMGIAVSSLNTVTLDPPTISFNIKEPSQALNAIRAAHGRFRVHFLAALSTSRDIIESFCSGNHPDAYAHRGQNLQVHVPQADTTTTTTTTPSPPSILGQSVCAAAECTLTQELTVADHVILVAQITALNTNDIQEPTIAYVDGMYRSLQSALVIQQSPKLSGAKQPATQMTEKPSAIQTKEDKTEGEKPVLDRAHELSIAYDFPLLPGEQERREYVERLKTYFLGIRIHDVKAFMRKLQAQTKIVAKSFGIDLEALLYFCQRGALNKGQQILPEFHGQLSAAQMAKLVHRAKEMVKADAQFLRVSYTNLLRLLGVQIGGSSLLPSDILNPLRAEGLVGPFQPSKATLPASRRRKNVLELEQDEHVLRQYLLTLTDKDILRTTLPVKLEGAGINITDFMCLQGAHTRLKVESCSRFYKDWKIDITGDVSLEEARVVVRRLINYLGIDRPDVFYAHLYDDVSDMMRNVGVHPLATGVNVTFIISKIRHLCSRDEPHSSLKGKIEDMLQPYFASNVTWEDLQTRVEQFVQKLPLRATTWKNRDQLAAMGLSGNTILSTPLSSTRQTLDESNLLDTLVAKALKNHYGNGTEEENEAIAFFLKDRYGFDVVARSVVATPEEALARSSADDLEAARLQHEEVTVPVRKTNTWIASRRG
ncbi:hypothetical protein N0V95_000970 [Ascochyta clinopodiicola]|nr:hypothetical protein N0V95_000970 [Ascochyta clinopodiicola]